MEVLDTIDDPCLPGSVARYLEDYSVSTVLTKKISVTLMWTYPIAGLKEELGARIGDALSGLDERMDVEVKIGSNIQSSQGEGEEPVAGVKNVIAVASGKGGVGKSTVSVNLALALVAEGARVGLLDADIYGPSQGIMLGVPSDVRPEIFEGTLLEPIRASGLQCMSMSFVATDNQPMVWRGPMASSALQQLVNQSHWDNLDYLIVDMPPGTGDIQLTLSQQVPLSGAVIVTTPQDIALLDARKGLEMFQKVNVPVLGIVENMSIHVCSQCGHEEAIFGEGGGEQIAQEYGSRLLAGLPLSAKVREQMDKGEPPVVADPESDLSMIFREMARQVGAQVVNAQQQSAQSTVISMDDD